MPHMKPLNWVYLLFLFIFMFILILILIFYLSNIKIFYKYSPHLMNYWPWKW